MPSSSPERRAAAAHVFMGDVSVDSGLEVDDADQHHLDRVLRLRPGEAVTVSDGRGSWRACVYAGAGRVEPAGEALAEPAPSPAVTVGFALTKGDKPEWAVQKLTEAGVDVIVPFVSARSVVRWDDDKARRNAERLARVAREAAMQSRRVWLPEVRPLASFDEAVDAASAGSGARPGQAPALAEPGGEPLDLAKPCVFVGPEGGWSPEELARGLANVSLGVTILRAETATLAAGLLLCSLRSGVVAEVRNHNR